MSRILIVGAGRGIGLATAQILNNEHELYTVSRTLTPELEKLNTHFHEMSIGDDSIGQLDFLPEQLDGLVYCPGSISLKPFGRFSQDDFLSDYRQNVLGAVQVIQHVLSRLKKSGNASVVLFSSVAAELGLPYHASISSAKAAIEGLTRSLAAEFAAGKIRFNAIAPSLTDTELASGLLSSEEKRNALAGRNPMQRIGNPQEIARLVKFLLDQENSWITGQIFGVDGGHSRLRV